jgi:hypothetical protein
MSKEGKGLNAPTSPWVLVGGIPLAAAVIWWLEIREPSPPPAAPSPPAVAAVPAPPERAPAERYEYIHGMTLYSRLNALDYEKHDGQRVYFYGVVAKVVPDLSECGSLIVHAEANAMHPIRCDMVCPHGSKGFGVTAKLTLEGTVHAGPLGAWMVDCRHRL